MTVTIRHLDVEANGMRFHVAATDEPEDAPAVLCLHGFPEGSEVWHAVMLGMEGVRVYAPDLRGYPGSDRPPDGYDVWTLGDDVRALIDVLGLDRPVLAGDDWGGTLAWVVAQRFPDAISRLVVVNGPHPMALADAIVRFRRLQLLRIPWVPFFQIPAFPEWLMTTSLGRRAVTWSIVVREGSGGNMDRALVRRLIDRFRRPGDFRPPIAYYREAVRTALSRRGRARMRELFSVPVGVPATQVWGVEDGALPADTFRSSDRFAGRPLEWRPLADIGHFVPLEAPELLARELLRVASPDGGS